MKTFKAAVVGKDVSKSLSPAIHSFIAEKWGYPLEYTALSVPEERFESSIDGILKEFDGLNITIPYKLSVIPHLKKTSGDASAYGAVNTVKTRDGTGYNTDGAGFGLMLENSGFGCGGKRALVLGAGGAGRSVVRKLVCSGADVSLYDRNFGVSRNVASEFGATAVQNTDGAFYAVINATGVGMHKTEGISPVGEDVLKNCEAAIDLIYVPEKSRFLEIAESLGKRTENGLAMLFYQAYFAECIFFDKTPDADEAKRYFEEFKSGRHI